LETKVKYLIDTNVWLERLLDQGKSEVTAKFLHLIPTDQLYVSDFAMHSIGVILSRLNKIDVLESFVNDLFINIKGFIEDFEQTHDHIFFYKLLTK